jgi:hypothetical protein
MPGSPGSPGLREETATASKQKPLIQPVPVRWEDPPGAIHT